MASCSSRCPSPAPLLIAATAQSAQSRPPTSEVVHGALTVQEKLKHDPHAGHLFVFRGRRGDLIKVIWHDGHGACLFTKRLERGRFIWPTPTEGAVAISPAQLGYMLDYPCECPSL